MSATSLVQLALALKAAGFNPAAPLSILHVEDRYLVTDGWRQPAYYDPTAAAFYQVGGVVPVAPTVADSDVGTGTFASATVLTYRSTSYNSRYDVETAPVEYSFTVGGGGPNNATHTFVDPSAVDAQYDQVRFYRKLTGGNFKIVATVAGNAGTWKDHFAESTLSTALPMVQRYRTMLPPKFRGWVFHQGHVIGWTGLDAILRFSQLRRVAVSPTGNVLTDFPDDAIFPVEPNDGYGVIVMVVQDGEALYVFKERAIYRVYGGPDPTDMDFEETCAGWGCIAAGSVVRIKSVIHFLAEAGAMRLPPGGTPELIANLADSGMSPLEPVWERINRRALHLIRGYHDVRRKRYVLHVPLDDDPVCSYRIICPYGNQLDRFDAVDEQVYLTFAADAVDGSGASHSLALDDLGNVIEMEYGASDLVPSSASNLGTVNGIPTSRAVSTNGTWAPGNALVGAPLELRSSADVLLEQNRALNVNDGSGLVQPLYYFSTTVVVGQIVRVGVIRSFFQTADIDGGDLRKEKELLGLSVEHRVETGGTLAVTCYQNLTVTQALDAMVLTATEGWQAVAGKGCRGTRLGFRFENANAGEPWAVTGFDYDFGEGRERR